MSSSSSPSLSADHHHLGAAAAAASSADHLCYVHCYICDTVLAVSVPPSSLFNTVTVRCGHCTNLLPVNMRGLLLPNHFQLALTPPPPHITGLINRLEEMPNPSPDLTMNQPAVSVGGGGGFTTAPATIGLVDRHLPRPPFLNRTAPEKRQRIPSAYNRFIKEEIQRIKAENPEISHREAFSAAAKNWAHFPHIHFGVVPDQSCSPVKSKAAAGNVNGRQQQESSNYGDQGRTNNSATVMIEGFNLASAAYS